MKPNLPLCEFPAAEAELTPWLERYLVSPDLGLLVDQLRLLHDADEPASPLSQLLNEEELQCVVRQGLAALPREALAKLLACPEALLELQERVFLADEPYWQQIAAAEACCGWGAKLDKAVQELENGTDPLVIRADVDNLVQRVTQELRDRAGSRRQFAYLTHHDRCSGLEEGLHAK